MAGIPCAGRSSFRRSDGGFGLGSGSAMLETGDYLSHSKAGILYEATTDTVIYAKNADMQLPPASMTKGDDSDTGAGRKS